MKLWWWPLPTEWGEKACM